jgi:hypothetical protein
MSVSVSLAPTSVRHDADRLHPLRRTESNRDLAYLIRTLLRFSAQPERGLSSPTSSAAASREKPGSAQSAPIVPAASCPPVFVTGPKRLSSTTVLGPQGAVSPCHSMLMDPTCSTTSRRAHYLAVHGRPRPAETLVCTAVSARLHGEDGVARFDSGGGSATNQQLRPGTGPSLLHARRAPNRHLPAICQ